MTPQEKLHEIDLKISKEKLLLINIIQAGLLEKFLNDPNRLGMTEQEQKDKLDAIESLSHSSSRDTSEVFK